EPDRQPEGKERARVSEAPGEAELCRQTPRVLLLRGDQRRHRREVVGIGCVTQAEQDGGADHEYEGHAVGKLRKVAVQAEHHVTFGRARTVIARPRPSTTSALSAGMSRSRPPSKSTRSKTRLAFTARRPM